MVEPTWDTIETLRDRLEATGFHETWAYGFVSSVLGSREMPRGRGDQLLREFLNTDWDTRAQKAEEVEALLPIAGLDEPWLSKLASDIRRGYEVPDWRQQRFEEIKDKVSKSEARVRTAEELEQLRTIEMLGRARGFRWWGHRPAQHKRYETILNAAKTNTPIHDADYTWIVHMFKGPLGDLQSDKHPPGALRYVKSYGDKMAMVLGKPYVQETTGTIVVDILPAGGTALTVPFALLKKRK